MITETSTKNQHYVPQFLLKKFSLDRKTIKVYQKDKRSIIENAPIKNQCSKKWFYGKGKTEDKLSQLEGDGAKVIKRVLEGKKVDFKEKAQLYQFIYLQSIRTQKKNDVINNVAKKIQKNYIEAVAKINNLGNIDEIEGIEELLSEFEANFKMTPENLIDDYKSNYNKILDLDFIILKIKNSEKNEECEFIIGDNPVVHYNYYFERFNGGLDRYGEMIIMPLGPYETIILYDERIYKFHNIKKNNIIEIEIEDVRKINNLQYIHCNKNIYFRTILEKQKDYFYELNIEKKPEIYQISDIVSINLDDKKFIDVKLSFFNIKEEGLKIKEACLQKMKAFREITREADIIENENIVFTYPLMRSSPKSEMDIRKEIFEIKTGLKEIKYFSK
ncbi:DUF4238 domain-containing protein [Cetobacterium sp. ZOR0034]|uniref:DUF4238 domain-containing protein n=1 Tax=Cetobacterium sp. ZOR0034 TaxID=1339239 RepID=UPI0006466920|nr:DUF4238 domain-containing protein [Cetobacterium sp. ZOR0034]